MRVPLPLDRDDRSTIGQLLLYLVLLVVPLILVLAVALGVAVRLFFLAKGV